MHRLILDRELCRLLWAVGLKTGWPVFEQARQDYVDINFSRADYEEGQLKRDQMDINSFWAFYWSVCTVADRLYLYTDRTHPWRRTSNRLFATEKHE